MLDSWVLLGLTDSLIVASFVFGSNVTCMFGLCYLSLSAQVETQEMSVELIKFNTLASSWVSASTLKSVVGRETGCHPFCAPCPFGIS